MRRLIPLTFLALAGCNSVGGPPPVMPGFESVQTAQDSALVVSWFTSLDIDCRLIAGVDGKITKPPQHGVAAVKLGSERPNYPAESTLGKCNGADAPSMVISYAPAKGFTGEDRFSYQRKFADGQTDDVQVSIAVAP
jgi:hypothetical protein